MIKLDLTLGSTLQWEIPPFDEDVVWELEFGWSTFSLLDPMPLATFQLAIDHFLERVPLPSKVILYRGKAEHDSRLLADYLHQLASRLPVETVPLALIDVSELSPARAAIYLSKEKFTHIEVGNLMIETTTGLLLPQDRYLTEEIIEKIDAFEKAVRIVPEVFMIEHWDGLDLIVYFEEALSDFGRRVLKGFEATGGGLKNIGVEGFEPPTYCSQSSRASQAALYPERTTF